MKSKILIGAIVWVCAVLAYASGGSSTNGGDAVRYRFMTARVEASSIVTSLTRTSLSPNEDPQIVDFLISNAAALALDISRSEHRWDASSAQATCAETTRIPTAPVFLSQERCEKIALAEAIQLVIHESIHHFGIDDEDFAYRASHAAFQGRRNPTATPLCNALAGRWVAVEGASGRGMVGPLAREIVIDAVDCGSIILSGWGINEVVLKEAREAMQRLTKDDEIFTVFTQAFPGDQGIVITWRTSIGMPAPRPADVRSGTVVLQIKNDGRLSARGFASSSSAKDMTFDEIGRSNQVNSFSGLFEKR